MTTPKDNKKPIEPVVGSTKPEVELGDATKHVLRLQNLHVLKLSLENWIFRIELMASTSSS